MCVGWGAASTSGITRPVHLMGQAQYIRTHQATLRASLSVLQLHPYLDHVCTCDVGGEGLQIDRGSHINAHADNRHFKSHGSQLGPPHPMDLSVRLQWLR
jgi:hypothetical protein